MAGWTAKTHVATPEKICSKCGRLLSVSEFYPAKHHRDGYGSHCKDCIREQRSGRWRETRASKTRVCDCCKRTLPLTDFARSRWTEAGRPVLCRICWHEQAIANRKARNKQWHQDTRRLVLEHYSGGVPRCACCGEDTYDFLTLDHIDNNGAIERREIGNAGTFLRWLVNNNFPEGYQVLCYNCNCAKGILGHCPHQTQGAQDE